MRHQSTSTRINKNACIVLYRIVLYCNADVQDKAGLPWWLGLSVKGITVYDHNDRKTPRKVGELL